MTKLQPSRSQPAKPHLTVPPGPNTSNLKAAELCLQRGEFDQAKWYLEKRIKQGNNDFKTLNLLGISMAHLRQNQKAAAIFQRLNQGFKSRAHRVKSGFNLGLVRFYQDLGVVGDLSVARYNQGSPGLSATGHPPYMATPFAGALDIWKKLLRGRPLYADIIHTYVSFAYLQSGDLENALNHLKRALSLHENFFVTHYVLGRVFLDLYYLASEGCDFMLPREMIDFFEIEQSEILFSKVNRHAVQRDTFLDIAMQGFLDGRNLSPMSTEILLNLCNAYLLAGLLEEAYEALQQAELFAPEALPTLETALRFHETVQAAPEVIKSLVQRIKSIQSKKPENQASFILPAYFLS